MSNCTDNLTSSEFCVQGIASDNNSSNVHSNVFAMFNSNSHQYIKHPENFDKKTYLFYIPYHEEH